ncbi:phage tail protein [Caballeronia sp. EK]|uniref:phage tail protein n=1 Tax=Caballeronia sp. EK TaxID=2767469 RepID=UPI0016555DF1|nr:phage tail protein [Caballeronia sp. EK]MBC8638265.1 phage tail protein [Caballeronia sp. EK]
MTAFATKLAALLPTSIIDGARLFADTEPILVPQASGLIFDWCVTTASYDLEPRIIKAQFGDGYAQRRPAGINTLACMWSITIRNATEKIAGEVVQFLSARNGVDVFNWTPPRQTVTQDVICPSWNLTYGDMLQNGDLLYNLSFKFEQVFL